MTAMTGTMSLFWHFRVPVAKLAGDDVGQQQRMLVDMTSHTWRAKI